MRLSVDQSSHQPTERWKRPRDDTKNAEHSKAKLKVQRIPLEALCPDTRCVYASLEEMVVLSKLLLQQLGPSGFITKTSVNWKQVAEVLGKDPVDCEFLFWNFDPKYFRRSLNLVVIEFDPRNIIPPNPEHEKEYDRFKTLIVSRMKQLLSYLDEPEKKLLPPVAPVLPHIPSAMTSQPSLDPGTNRQFAPRPMGFGPNAYLEHLRGAPASYPFVPLPVQFGNQYLPYGAQMAQMHHLNQFGTQQLLQMRQAELQNQFMYVPQSMQYQNPLQHPLANYGAATQMHNAMMHGSVTQNKEGTPWFNGP